MESYRRFVRGVLTLRDEVEMTQVDALAQELRDHIERTREIIRAIHVHGASSKSIQEHFADLLRHRLGFDEEVVITPQDGLVSRARPDFVYQFGDGRGIIAEIERGGTITNNHDLKDLWKTHVAPDVQHLFLVVPMNNWKADGSARERPFLTVARRLGAFFGDPRREIDVLSAHVFGY